jgi:rhamnogalacturonyl hydrolase YesR
MSALLALFATTIIFPVQAAQPYSSWMADSAIARGQGHNSTWNYEHGTFWYALEGVYRQTGQAKYYDWIKNGTDSVVSDSGDIGGYVKSDYQLDPLRIGQSLIFL